MNCSLLFFYTVKYDPKKLFLDLCAILAHDAETPNMALGRLNPSQASPSVGSRSLLPGERKRRKEAKEAEEEKKRRDSEAARESAQAGVGKPKRRVWNAEWGTWVDAAGNDAPESSKRPRSDSANGTADGATGGATDANSMDVAVGTARKRIKLDTPTAAHLEIGRISELCNLLIELGHFHVYDTPRIQLRPKGAEKEEQDRKAKQDELARDFLDSDDEEEAAPAASAPGPAAGSSGTGNGNAGGNSSAAGIRLLPQVM